MILAVANQKGGVGKTTTVASLSMALSAAGKRVLSIDLDPQASLTFYVGHDEAQLEQQRATLYHALTEQRPLEAIVLGDNPAFVPSGITLAKAEAELIGEPNRTLVLNKYCHRCASITTSCCSIARLPSAC